MNWNRAELKARAKGDLSGSYWYAFLVSLLVAITGGSHHWGGGGSAGGTSGAGADEFSLWMGLLILFAVIIALGIRVFIGFAIEVGGRKFFIQLPSGQNDLGYVGYGFQGSRYYDIVVPYILADNPSIGHSRAIDLSKQMTMGEKFDIFVLDLSFLGWFLLGALALGIGVLFVQPYYDATNAELYFKLREKALYRGITTPEELTL